MCITIEVKVSTCAVVFGFDNEFVVATELSGCDHAVTNLIMVKLSDGSFNFKPVH